MKTFWIYTYAVLLVVKSIPQLIKVKKMNDQPFEKKAWTIHQTAVDICTKAIRETKSNVMVQGLENLPEGPVLFVSNHQSLFDILLFLGYINRPIGFIAKKEIKKIPLINAWMEEMQCVFIDRSNRRSALKVIDDGVESLEKGQSMVVFPEGTRSKDGSIQPFKSGSLRLATRANVPIVPVAIKDTRYMLEANDGKINAANIELLVGTPIMPETYQSLKATKIADRVYREVLEMLGHELPKSKATETNA
ncbi:1-acyl-sn-glycerol-3-phosphate acyltransferase [Streptohalobacillus salinus]|uniref:1-acyl-sn-glycerol-3-phosphate acyltransferase n=1 Tax=Streptohalobacillus salinus TaxID=621096 RepID=A0A2V3W3Y5_9BACI|nr:lysophospholipid acyltransferase family protein [Streptohalobacillus salinus]PXW89007.1 1-acyl-sn-glycerol-3-phosphate acyltransferase [Streptohalobacillus salinus]